MKIVIAMDSFKGSLSSLQAGRAVLRGIRRLYPDEEVVVRPLADGGEGTVEALTLGMRGHLENLQVTGPLGEPVNATYGILGDRNTAIIEISQAAGITLVEPGKRNPMYTTTYGVGELIVDAIQNNCRHFIIGLGGSATNDGGAGMLAALGFDLLDENGKPIPFGAEGLALLREIRADRVIPELSECEFRIACDVNNPLCGEQGASYIFAPQKGADKESILRMDQWLKDYAALAALSFPKADRLRPGTGAAGGLGFAFLTFMNAELQSGIEIVLDETGLEEFIKDADLVITGEGCLDGQTVMGKAPIGVARLGKKHGKRVIAFGGSVTEDARYCHAQGIDALFSITPGPMNLSYAMQPEVARKNLAMAAEQVMRLLKDE